METVNFINPSKMIHPTYFEIIYIFEVDFDSRLISWYDDAVAGFRVNESNYPADTEPPRTKFPSPKKPSTRYFSQTVNVTKS